MPKRKQRIKRRAYFGTEERPRLTVFRSSNNISAQIINDISGKTLVAASSLKMKSPGNVKIAKEVGKELAKTAVAAGITKVVFDRGGNRFHGRIKALADGAREGGLQF